ncbi:hypothetical protein LU298_10375 [Komagataeibacter intermedius]|uniref:Uncharacterized protein n=2 Tax=Komagataeibacter intermedius TaxID=66229 RepID=A0A0C1RZY6_9PROT|nr:hypothetical protein [Komagataeibacter intermedius]KPH86032.1 hypothetical protein GLUCOINTEAF2_0200883 [Komagataeibacter intermedius AF2]KPH86394.1 hypothetical protein GLUCOINTEAF2_0200814 [Komagataeibacter intermedius AF2]MCF3636898.1 hypothetical protein [Komagataeibacter intermedius]GAN86526.1 hypothetical protein Gain_0031_021 [Komagataeibacter intermedius TF2]GBQ76281.1 hypothetical protein AA0521_2860 [Komagataeibacter intermedius NRIC 0521]
MVYRINQRERTSLTAMAFTDRHGGAAAHKPGNCVDASRHAAAADCRGGRYDAGYGCEKS